jgi:tRNASer (uridine44-2'-O)-methyltransferase
LGCGNGLLPHLLTQEGFNGKKSSVKTTNFHILGCGIDARTRRIWDQFAEKGTDLRKTSMDPSDPACPAIPSETDFLIGNHSDELTPWIPILAAR